MGYNNLEKEIVEIISEISGYEIDEITLESNLAKDLEIDSIKAIEIVVSIEKKYRISIRDEDVTQITTARQIVDLAYNYIAEKEKAS